MLDNDKVSVCFHRGDVCGVHALLDAAMPGETVDERHSIVFWRTATLIKQQRYEEALAHLTVSRSVYGCKTLAHHEMARIYDHLGRDQEAIEVLDVAPFDQEAEKYPMLVNEAKFHLLFLKVRNGIKISLFCFDEIASDYIAVLPDRKSLFGQHVSKNQIMAMLAV